MTVLSAQTIRKLCLVYPCLEATKDSYNNSKGLSACGYDLSVAEEIHLGHDHDNGQKLFVLASTEQYFALPINVVGRIHDKSSLARKGLAVQNTVLEPGWRGFLTLELTYHGTGTLHFPVGSAIAQVLFEFLDEPTELPYAGKYQDQPAGPTKAR